ncbi:hypothetical protein IV494_11345 [Kaistella sp. G5-32]|uniref:Uncharacterized protein n=1 Tax=Kaistella gelatinilytica TaxID=2787636 RepID=A0ABS0FDH5_9FLAO|nr:hypothetical protein [Kaistella gelatinilytica]MBF8457774.1 hypothetical protein [Kaistella gelatinilytica]
MILVRIEPILINTDALKCFLNITKGDYNKQNVRHEKAASKNEAAFL